MAKKFQTMAIDLSSLAYRSYYGLPDSLRSAEGKPVNAIKGYLDAILRLKKVYKPINVYHALDENWRPEWRVKLLPEYKSHRVFDDEEEVPDDLEYQLEVLPKILEDLGMQTIGITDNEADDVLATIATQKEDVIIISGDRDLLQLVNDKRNIAVHLLGKDGGKFYDEKEVLLKHLVKASQYIDYSVLRGDASDGLPGVKGIGEKTAAKYISTFDNIDNLIDAARNSHKELSIKLSNNILDAIEYIVNARTIVKLSTDLIVKLRVNTKFEEESVTKKYQNLKINNQIKEFASSRSSS